MIFLLSLIAFGFLLKRLTPLPMHFHKSLNHFILYLSLPATVLTRLPALIERLSSEQRISWIVLQPWLWFIFTFLFFHFLTKRKIVSMRSAGALILVVGLGNTSFVGLPVLESYLGVESIPFGLLLDQLGSFLVLSVFAIPLMVWFKANYGGIEHEPSVVSKSPSFHSLALQVFRFPPFLSLIIVVALAFLKLDVSKFDALRVLSQTLTPLALISVGIQIQPSQKSVLKGKGILLGFALLMKNLLAPLISLLLIKCLGLSTSVETQTLVLESSMGSMITAGIVSEEFGFDPQLTQQVVSYTILLSLGLSSVWYTLSL